MPGRRIALYFSWNWPAEAGAELGGLENRYPTLFEFRRALWPHFEHAADPKRFDQGIGGFLKDVVLGDFDLFRRVVKESTGNEVTVIHRTADKGVARELDRDFLAGIDTLIVVSLDHRRTAQRPTSGEAEMLRDFLAREEACLVVCPHHDVGASEDPSTRIAEFTHHADRLVPAQQRIGGFACGILEALGIPVVNCYGLSPARATDGSPERLVVHTDLDVDGLLRGVITFNLHPHLPHLAVLPTGAYTVDVLAERVINPAATEHPFVLQGHRTFNALLRTRAGLAGRVVIGDATLWSAAFQGLESLKAFWRNIAELPLGER
ncbi:hypothetical protein FHW79_002829 [Azospirillum sp. OGB3]|uniref:hypothetical protein n=1 Tax=Azospirillum sp. OGB3 TaxID=2587012 RepID=UPI001605E10A|nr:hypothetical protein [Azospirillum sp. OGB3]MBB3265209.1 hypothetical protein [Azospirillum sp. OGB3]